MCIKQAETDNIAIFDHEKYFGLVLTRNFPRLLSIKALCCLNRYRKKCC